MAGLLNPDPPFLHQILKKDFPNPVSDQIQIQSAVADLTFLNTYSVHSKYTQFKAKVNRASTMEESKIRQKSTGQKLHGQLGSMQSLFLHVNQIY